MKEEQKVKFGWGIDEEHCETDTYDTVEELLAAAQESWDEMDGTRSTATATTAAASTSALHVHTSLRTLRRRSPTSPTRFMTTEEQISKITEELNNYAPDFDKLKIWGDRGQMFTSEDIKKLIHRRPDPHAWYKRDLKRKRPNRKHGRNLYKGIQAYRQRVGQPLRSREGLGFRGVATQYDRLRIEAVRKYPELADRIPDLYVRYMNLRFPVAEFHSKLLGIPPRNRGIDLHKYGISDTPIVINRPDNAWFVTPSMVTAGGDAVEKADPHDDAVMGIAMAMLRDD